MTFIEQSFQLYFKCKWNIHQNRSSADPKSCLNKYWNTAFEQIRFSNHNIFSRNLFFFKELNGISPNILNINNTLLDDPWIKEVIKDTRKYFEQMMMKENM